MNRNDCNFVDSDPGGRVDEAAGANNAAGFGKPTQPTGFADGYAANSMDIFDDSQSASFADGFTPATMNNISDNQPSGFDVDNVAHSMNNIHSGTSFDFNTNLYAFDLSAGGFQLPVNEANLQFSENGSSSQLPANGISPQLSMNGISPQLSMNGISPQLSMNGSSPQIPVNGSSSSPPMNYGNQSRNGTPHFTERYMHNIEGSKTRKVLEREAHHDILNLVPEPSHSYQTNMAGIQKPLNSMPIILKQGKVAQPGSSTDSHAGELATDDDEDDNPMCGGTEQELMAQQEYLGRLQSAARPTQGAIEFAWLVSQELKTVQAANQQKYPEAIAQAQAIISQRPVQMFPSVGHQEAAAHNENDMMQASYLPAATEAQQAPSQSRRKGKAKAKARAGPTPMMRAPVRGGDDDSASPSNDKTEKLDLASQVARPRSEQLQLEPGSTESPIMTNGRQRVPYMEITSDMSHEEKMNRAKRNQRFSELDRALKRQKNNEAAARGRRAKKELIENQGARITQLEAQVAAKDAEIAAKEVEIANLRAQLNYSQPQIDMS